MLLYDERAQRGPLFTPQGRSRTQQHFPRLHAKPSFGMPARERAGSAGKVAAAARAMPAVSYCVFAEIFIQPAAAVGARLSRRRRRLHTQKTSQ